MGIQLTWDNPEQTIFRVVYDGDWSTAEFFEDFDRSKAMIARVNHPVVMILDLSKSGNPPPRFFTLINYVHRNEPQGVIQALVLRGNSPFKVVMDALIRIMPGAKNKLRFVDSLEQAHAIAAELLEEVARPAQP